MKIFEYKDPTVENGKYVIFELRNIENIVKYDLRNTTC